MKTIILPGYSPSNKGWAEEIQDSLRLDHEILVHEWQHWEGGKFSLPKETERILKTIGKEKVNPHNQKVAVGVNIIAKSVGTRVAMRIITTISDQVSRLILCGIPTKGTSDAAKKNYSPLANFPSGKVVVFQNTKDPLANYSDIKKFIGSINPRIKIIEKSRSDHHYPYSKDFFNLLIT